jgi:antitoxin HicB
MNPKYPLRLYWDEESTVWIAEYFDLNGCMGAGDTLEEAIQEADIFKEMWIEAALKCGAIIPEPSDHLTSSYSGKFVVRVGRGIHRELAIRAGEEGVSLNALCATYLTKGLMNDVRRVSVGK